ncbi:S9 family peptidase [Promicromonospora thailandica]|uniref:Oligopeptidase B n=1 Tax=Promicromonospora thailandica TaxID=765201 RepID=A0A9X2G3N3_9MICO|nr:S9 family peptidase [Promicromonospora thailandica]MCP2265118.1 oligopeptidase B [Promicromonospora thailandica]BFF19812.1 S9 family peptidase [Promicromonospora thailandica]
MSDALTSFGTESSAGAPPVTPRRPAERTFHGDTFVDDYEWLRAKDDPEVVAHLEAQNAWTLERQEHLAPLRQAVFDEIKGRTLETDLSVPSRDGDWWYYARTVEGQQYPIHARYPAAGPDDWTPRVLEPGEPVPGEQVLLDQNAEADGHDFFALGSLDVSEDGTRLLYATDTSGDERYTLRVRDLATGEDLTDEITETAPGALFAPDGEHVFYLTVDEAWRPWRVWRHRLGTPGSDDVVVFEEPDERYWVGVGLSRSKKYLQIELGSKVTSESWLLESDDPTGEFRVVWPRREGVEYSVEHAVLPTAAGPEDTLLILHNQDALNFELVSSPVPAPGGKVTPEEATVVVPHDPAVRLEGVSASERYLVLYYRREAISRSAVLQLPASGPVTWDLQEISFGQPLESVGAGVGVWEQPNLKVGYTSFVTPQSLYLYDVASGERTLLKQQPVLGGYDPGDYDQRREWAVAEDGTRVPISLVWRRDAVRFAEGADAPAEPAPLLLYGYGAYEYSIDPYFSVARLSLLDRGVVFAVAHVRGGGEMGRAWYDDGKLGAKRNTFTDFVACGRHLVGSGWTASDRLVADGGSAGGLLVGAVTNLAPELFTGVLAGVPFVDALTSMLDPSLPLTVTEWDEWGDPLHDPEVYAYMRSYTPYENVADDAAHYPRVLATTSFNDTRVLYVEPAKWIARLQAAGAPAMLKIEMSAGHGGVSGRYSAWEQIAFEHAWVLDVLGLADR